MRTTACRARGGYSNSQKSRTSHSTAFVAAWQKTRNSSFIQVGRKSSWKEVPYYRIFPTPKFTRIRACMWVVAWDLQHRYSATLSTRYSLYRGTVQSCTINVYSQQDSTNRVSTTLPVPVISRSQPKLQVLVRYEFFFWTAHCSVRDDTGTGYCSNES
jgi:hypothetical protein